MGKYSSFKDLPKNSFWPTPIEPVTRLIPHLIHNQKFWEPCAGDGTLARHLESFGLECVGMSDPFPQGKGIAKKSAQELGPMPNDVMFITNTPWPSREVTSKEIIEIISALVDIAPTWALFKANIANNKYFSELPHCACIVPAGRPSWLGNGKGGKEDAAWYLFDNNHHTPTEQYPFPRDILTFEDRDRDIKRLARNGLDIPEIAHHSGCYSGTVREVLWGAS